MSTVMYAYRIDKDKFWGVVEDVRDFYYKNGIPGLLVQKIDDGMDAMETFTGDKLKDALTQLQLFDEGKTWLFRVIENGYLFMNSREEEEWPITDVFYDNRTDIPEEHTDNEKYADWLDEKMSAQEYFMVDITTASESYQRWWNRQKENQPTNKLKE